MRILAKKEQQGEFPNKRTFALDEVKQLLIGKHHDDEEEDEDEVLLNS